MSSTSDNTQLSNQVPLSVDWPDPASKEFIGELTLRDKTMAGAVNSKASSLFLNQETGNFEQFFTPGNPQQNRNVYRKVIDMGDASAPVPHGITGIVIAPHIYGGCVTNVPEYLPIPYASVTSLTDQIELSVDIMNVTVTKGSTVDPITSCYVILEYLKN